MIYQLRVSLKHLPAPVWRRIEIDSSVTFTDLHYILQAAFEWEDCHLHTFFIRQSNGKTIKNRVEIGPDIDDLLAGPTSHYTKLNESTEIVSHWLTKKNDHCLYIYDFGDDWQHEIVLEKIIERKEDALYPRCTMAVGASPEEDSFGMLESIESIDSDRVCAEINQVYRNLFEENGTHSEEASHSEWLKLFELVDELKKLKPWQWMDNKHVFALNNPIDGDYVYCSVLGSAEQEYGLVTYIGQQGLKALDKFYTMPSIHDMIFEQHTLFISFSNRDELEKKDYQLIKSLGLKYRGKKQWPLFRSYVPGLYPWWLNKKEVELLTEILPQVINICLQMKEHRSLIPAYNGKEVVRFDTELQKYIFVVHPQEAAPVPVPEIQVNELFLQRMRKQMNRMYAPIEFDYFYLNDPIQEYPGQRPFFPLMMLAVECEQELIIYQDIVRMSELHTVADCLLDLINKLQLLPSEIYVQRHNLYTLLEPLANKLDIKLKKVPNLPVMTEVKEELFSELPF
ncbi:plasmid pRiA4b ORF-3 family protein [Bacillus sp. AGMB 02131]|uniref:Plasmid pRiA4b ORF-3 family protein n=1 Tax=Peribacillus faecalis TaxID=2772559 RepID=A0A927CVS1_9BACI|nr:plasmid pRiA4b ORF-3 family protein [Peribacillus faecalis]MBD3108523.1 plasmid pRiA4b ORF-3 family protein [Peribacillus faecalis]